MKHFIFCTIFVCFCSLLCYSQGAKLNVEKVSKRQIQLKANQNSRRAPAPNVESSVIGYLHIEGIEGESRRINHEDEIEIYSISWSATTPEASRSGSGRSRSRSIVNPFVIGKQIDKASPYLMLSQLKGKNFPRATITLVRSSHDTSFEYMTYELRNVTIQSFDHSVNQHGEEEIALAFEEISVIYREQRDDHSPGDEHEIQYDISAGV